MLRGLLYGEQEHDYLEEMSLNDRFIDTVSVAQSVNSTYSVNQVIAGGFDARTNLQVMSFYFVESFTDLFVLYQECAKMM